MPTATTTILTDDMGSSPTSVISLKSDAPQPQAAESSTAATLRSLYPRAAKAFLQRDITLTHNLLISAFGLLRPPLYAGEDEFAAHRRKWDILRITLETTVYASPPPADEPNAFPQALRANQVLSPQSLVSSLLARSLELFTPPPNKPSPYFLPHQILVTLILASLRLGCPEVGRSMIEEWLARCVPETFASDEARLGYIKILELYCLHILPRMEEWEYAEDFLRYEHHLEESMRQTMSTTIRQMHTQAIAATEAADRLKNASKSSRSRSISPARSDSSKSSSSTHTATPRTPHPNVYGYKGKEKAKERSKPLTNGEVKFPIPPQLTSSLSSSSSLSVASTATSRTITPASANRSLAAPARDVSGKNTPNGHVGNGHALSHKSREASSASISRAGRAVSVRPSTTLSSPSTLAVFRSYIQSLIENTSKSKLAAFILLFVIFPAVSFIFRLRRRRLAQGTASGAGGAADVVRRRLAANQTVGGGFLKKLWDETLRAVGDSVRMGGRGLV